MIRTFAAGLLAGLGLIIVVAPAGADEKSPSIRATEVDAAHVWTPEEAATIAFDRFLRALPPGEMVRLGPGTFQRPFELSSGLSLQGAGADRTVIETLAGPRAIKLAGTDSDPVTLAGLRVRQPGQLEPARSEGAMVELKGPGAVTDVVIGPIRHAGITVIGDVDVEKIRITGALRGGLRAFRLPPDAVVDGLVVEGVEEGFDLTILRDTGGTYRNLELAGDGDGAIVIQGGLSAPVFEGLDTFTLNDILYEKRAAPREKVTDEVLEKLVEAQRPRPPADMAEARARRFYQHHERQLPVRRELSRTYNRAIAEAGADSGGRADALSAYLRALIGGYGPEGYDPWVDPVVRRELAWFLDAHGPETTFDVIETLPDDLRAGREYYLMMFEPLAREDLVAVGEKREAQRVAAMRKKAFAGVREKLAAGAKPVALAEAFLAATRRYFALQKEHQDVWKVDVEALAPDVAVVFAEVLEKAGAPAVAAVLEAFPNVGTDELPGRRVFLTPLSSGDRRAVLRALRDRRAP